MFTFNFFNKLIYFFYNWFDPVTSEYWPIAGENFYLNL